jgi:hypothetical protein
MGKFWRRGGLKPQPFRSPRFTREITAIVFTTVNFQIARLKCYEVLRSARKPKKYRKTVARSSPRCFKASHTQSRESCGFRLLSRYEAFLKSVIVRPARVSRKGHFKSHDWDNSPTPTFLAGTRAVLRKFGMAVTSHALVYETQGPKRVLPPFLIST